jgi:hypothetical protein
MSGSGTMETFGRRHIRTAIEMAFPTGRLATADYVMGSMFLVSCFALFLHADIQSTGWYSLSYLFGSPLEFYENLKKGHGVFSGAYLPPIYLIFALWLYPLKLLGVISGPEIFPLYLSYWLKILTTMAYMASGLVFYRISLRYCPDNEWAKYATAAWLISPLALFSQIIFSQYDIFYVLPTLAGFLMFLRGRPYSASALFSFAITVKYFPAFVFIPLLLLYEKRVWRIALCCLILIAPTLAINLVYSQSLAFIEGVRNYTLLDRIYEASLNIGYSGYWRVYLLLALFTVLCGLAYFTEVTEATLPRIAAYFLLTSSLLPFCFIFWHPQWMIFPAAAIVLTSAISGNSAKFMVLDLVGMFFFVATTSLTFRNNVDGTMFRPPWPNAGFDNSFPMATLFDWFGEHSRNVFLSGFWGYLVLQVILKFKVLLQEVVMQRPEGIDYGNIRRRLYIGLAIFLLPVFFSIYKSHPKTRDSLDSYAPMPVAEYPILHVGSLEQTFIAKGNILKQVSLSFGVVGTPKSDVISIEIADAGGNRLATVNKTLSMPDDIAWCPWHEFYFDPIHVSNNARYRLRLTSLAGTSGNAFTLSASADDSYKGGHAIVDGIPQKWDFVFRIGFVR